MRTTIATILMITTLGCRGQAPVNPAPAKPPPQSTETAPTRGVVATEQGEVSSTSPENAGKRMTGASTIPSEATPLASSLATAPAPGVVYAHAMAFDELTEVQRCVVCEKTKEEIIATQPTAAFQRAVEGVRFVWVLPPHEPLQFGVEGPTTWGKSAAVAPTSPAKGQALFVEKASVPRKVLTKEEMAAQDAEFAKQREATLTRDAEIKVKKP